MPLATWPLRQYDQYPNSLTVTKHGIRTLRKRAESTSSGIAPQANRAVKNLSKFCPISVGQHFEFTARPRSKPTARPAWKWALSTLTILRRREDVDC